MQWLNSSSRLLILLTNNKMLFNIIRNLMPEYIKTFEGIILDVIFNFLWTQRKFYAKIYHLRCLDPELNVFIRWKIPFVFHRQIPAKLFSRLFPDFGHWWCNSGWQLVKYPGTCSETRPGWGCLFLTQSEAGSGKGLWVEAGQTVWRCEGKRLHLTVTLWCLWAAAAC